MMNVDRKLAYWIHTERAGIGVLVLMWENIYQNIVVGVVSSEMCIWIAA